MDVKAMMISAMRDNPARIALECKGEPIDCGTLSTFADRLSAMLDEAGVPKEAPIALVARNTAGPASAMLALAESGRTFSNIYPFQSGEAIAADLEKTRFMVMIAEERDWTPPVVEAARKTGMLALVLRWDTEERISALPGLDRLGDGPFRDPLHEPGVEILSSGTTGPPKRLAIPSRVLTRAVESIAVSGLDRENPPPDVVIWPIVGLGGVCNMIGNFSIKRTIVLIERFNVPEYLDALARHEPPMVNVPPAVLRMLLDAKVPPEALSSLKYMFGGSAPLTIELQDEFEATYPIKVIWAYGATEFCGTLTTWTPALYDEFSKTKKGSIGRALPGVMIRIVDPETGAILPNGEVGLMEAYSAEISDEWIRTTDLATIDDDGFLFHKGRNDGVIIRGGFKVSPDKIDEVMREHPAILDAATVGIPHERLGAVPAVAVELKKGAQRPTPAELEAHIRSLLPSTHVPARYMILDALPRTASLKPQLGELKRLFAEEMETA